MPPLLVPARSVHYGMMQDRFQWRGGGYMWQVVVVVKFCPSQTNFTYPSSILMQKEALHENQVDVAFLLRKKKFLVLFQWFTKLNRSYA